MLLSFAITQFSNFFLISFALFEHSLDSRALRESFTSKNTSLISNSLRFALSLTFSLLALFSSNFLIQQFHQLSPLNFSFSTIPSAALLETLSSTHFPWQRFISTSSLVNDFFTLFLVRHLSNLIPPQPLLQPIPSSPCLSPMSRSPIYLTIPNSSISVPSFLAIHFANSLARQSLSFISPSPTYLTSPVLQSLSLLPYHTVWL